LIAPNPTTVFRWTGTLGFDANGIANVKLRWENLFNQDFMLPGVSEVIQIRELNLFPWYEATQFDRLFVS
jgi:hypothetical protein